MRVNRENSEQVSVVIHSHPSPHVAVVLTSILAAQWSSVFPAWHWLGGGGGTGGGGEGGGGTAGNVFM